MRTKTLREVLEPVEALHIKQVLGACRYNQSLAATRLGIGRAAMRNKLFKYFGDKYFKMKNTIEEEEDTSWEVQLD